MLSTHPIRTHINSHTFLQASVAYKAALRTPPKPKRSTKPLTEVRARVMFVCVCVCLDARSRFVCDLELLLVVTLLHVYVRD